MPIPVGALAHRVGGRDDQTTQAGVGTVWIGLTSIFVDDQDQAERFSTQVFGFQVKTGAPMVPRNAG
jgi:hypothetical protein